jgi:hypothetical protein
LAVQIGGADGSGILGIECRTELRYRVDTLRSFSFSLRVLLIERSVLMANAADGSRVRAGLADLNVATLLKMWVEPLQGTESLSLPRPH